MPSFNEYAAGKNLVVLSESSLGSLYVPAENTDHVMVRRFDREWPSSLLTTYLDMLEAAQLWLDRHTALAPILRVERPFEIGDDYYVMRHYPHYWSTKHLAGLPPDEDPEVELYERLKAELLGAVKTVSGERDVLLASILSRAVVTPSAWTFHVDDESKFAVVDPPATRAEGEMWLAHPAWHANPG
jgi:hypothetical protein